MNDINYIEGDDLIFTDEGDIQSGGFSVKSIMMKAGMSPIMTVNEQQGGGNFDKVSDLFNNLVIPNWALSYSNKMGGGKYKDKEEDEDSEDDIDDDLHDKLIDLVRHHENLEKETKKKKTRKHKLTNKKGGTKRYK
jgi:hypothetical protein